MMPHIVATAVHKSVAMIVTVVTTAVCCHVSVATAVHKSVAMIVTVVITACQMFLQLPYICFMFQ